MTRWRIVQGDCVERMAELPEASVDAICTDPPYGIGFMGHEWDQPGEFGPVRRNGRPSGGQWNRPNRSGPADRGSVVAGSYDLSQTANRRFQAWCEAWAREALRVLKPGGHMLVFGGTRTYHRMASGIEDAGFEVRDCITWMYGSGFPKSLDVSKAIDKAARGVPQGGEDPTSVNHGRFKTQATEGARGDADTGRGYGAGPGQFMAEAGEREDRELVDEAASWRGWGTALKPASEPIVVARKPLAGTVAGNVLAHGTGALNIDGCRVGFAGAADEAESKTKNRHADFGSGPRENAVYGQDSRARGENGNYDPPGRWPANVVLSHADECVQLGARQVKADGHHPARRGASGYGSNVLESNGGGLHGHDGLSERHADGELVERWACVPGCPVRMLDDQTGSSFSGGTSGAGAFGTGVTYGDGAGQTRGDRVGFGDRGGASRFFYCAKASGGERNAGLDAFEAKPMRWSNGDQNPGSFQSEGSDRAARNSHPTVKPIDLMRWLIRLVTPLGGVVLDPFTGSGTTGVAAVLEGFEFVGVEREPEYVAIAEARIRWWSEHPRGVPIERALESAARRRKSADSGQLDLLGMQGS